MHLEESNDPKSLSDYLQIGNTFTKYPFRRVAADFGKELADEIFKADLGKWYGPFQSNKGIEYFRVLQTHEPELASFEAMEYYLRTDYLFEKGRESQLAKIQEMKKNYEIVFKD